MIMQKATAEKGFTVLELIVVVGILALITSLSTKYMVKETNDARQNYTLKRIDQIRYAIIGDSSRTLNGQPAFSGYIADTGAMPKYLRDLVSNSYCTDVTFRDKQACVGAGKEWREAANWKGPYLQAISYKDITDDAGNVIASIPVFRDGWGNRQRDDVPAAASGDNLNFGWDFRVTPDAQDVIRIASLGLNGTSKDDRASSKFQYERDVSSVITRFQVGGASVNVNVINASLEGDESFCLKVTYRDGTSEFVDLGREAVIPAGKIFGDVRIIGLIKKKDQPACETASIYQGIGELDYFAHNLFHSGKLDLLIK